MDTINRFAELDDVNKHLIANAIITTFMVGKCSPEILKKNIDLPESIDADVANQIYNQLFINLADFHVICSPQYMDADGNVENAILCWMQIDEDVRNLLIETGHTEEEIRAYIHELPDDKKETLSGILRDDQEWIDSADELPEVNTLVAMRIVNPTLIAQRNGTQKVLEEDICIGHWDGNKWNIEGPHPFIGYTVLIKDEALAPGTIVSHWREATDEEIESWHHRYDPINTYGYLDIFVDSENREKVYRALIHGSNMLHRFAKSEEHQKDVFDVATDLANTLSDIAGCFDRGGIYNEPDLAYDHMNGVIEKKIRPYITPGDLKD